MNLSVFCSVFIPCWQKHCLQKLNCGVSKCVPFRLTKLLDPLLVQVGEVAKKGGEATPIVV